MTGIVMDFFFAFRFAVFFATLLCAAIDDAQTMTVRRYPLLLATSTLVILPSCEPSFDERLAGCLTGLCSFGAVRFLFRKRLGLGDVWLAALIGAEGGPFFFAMSVIVACALMLPASRSRPFPLAPALFAGSLANAFSLFPGKTHVFIG